MLRDKIEEKEREYEAIFNRMFRRGMGHYELMGAGSDVIVNVSHSEYERTKNIFISSFGASGIILVDAIVYVNLIFMKQNPDNFIFMDGTEPKTYSKEIDIDRYSDSLEGDYVKFPNTLVYITDEEHSLVGYIPIQTLKVGFNKALFGIDFIHIFPLNGAI